MNLCSRSKVVVVLLMTALAVPIAAEQFTGADTQASLSATSVPAITAAEVREQATADKVLLRRQRRQYWQAIDQYQNLVRDGAEGLVAPALNDAASIKAYINGDVTKEVQADSAQTSSAPQASSLLVDNLSETDRHLLRWYSKTNTCPVSLKGYLPGFYELCLTVTKDASKEPRVGLLNDLQTTRAHSGAPKPTTKLRLEMLKEAYDRTNRRTDMAVPGRPTSSSTASVEE
ncbi:MAG: hypothetical protein PHH13_04100 [Candidatus Peribacteraceae bacterium]|nr:hypothetical protein [Candidatus Peribacteraceae bacterium]